MKRSRYILIPALAVTITLLSGIVLSPCAVYAHKFHASFARMNYNEQEQTVQVTLRIFADDLENILSRRTGRSIRLDKTPDAAVLTLAYLQSSFELRGRDGRTKKLVWVGMEPEVDTVWVYVEAKVGPNPEALTVSNRILFDLFDDQVNLLHFRFIGKKADLVFKPGDRFKEIAGSS